MPKKIINTTLSFTADFQQNATETLKPGAEVTILFDSNRLPFELLSNEKGKTELSVSAFYQFSSEGAINELKLASEKAKKGKATSGETILKGVFTIPTDSNEAIIWFLNTDKNGEPYFDSNFGKNYHFPIVAEISETTLPAKKARAKKA